MLEGVRELQAEVLSLNGLLKKIKTTQVGQKRPKESAQAVVDDYFRSVRPSISNNQIDNQVVLELDNLMQSLLEATHKRTSLSIYKSLANKIKKSLINIEKLALLENSDIGKTNIKNDSDSSIIQTLKMVCPSAALSYEQATIDLQSNERLSWRGPATDYREALRECLDTLAPDVDVMAADGFKLEKNISKPTMKQKAQFILKKRKQTRNAIKPVQDSIAVVEESVGAFVRSVYTRASISTHTPTNKSEVTRVRDQVRTVLCELLEIA
ncbi:MAG: hypothetical protein KBT63_05700 [Porticoccaceae bacterium]|nr:hypothetical protein [Porticoccaceae bacterium]